jgi:hypothetical protein
MPVLHLGVIDLPYQIPPPKRRRRRISAGQVTTGDVATWLENRYHIMEVFYEEHRDDIVGNAIDESLQGAIESVMLGAPPAIDPFGSATSKIEDGLKQFIVGGEMEKLGYPGVPTKAAQLRASGRRRGARFKTAQATGTGAAAVSFYDSGLYEGSIKAWVD